MPPLRRRQRLLIRPPRTAIGRGLWCAGLLVLLLHLVVGIPGLLDDGCPGCDNLGVIQVEVGPPAPRPALVSWPCITHLSLCHQSEHNLRPSSRAPPEPSQAAV